MKKVGIKMALVAIIALVGSFNVSAQNSGNIEKGPKGDAIQLKLQDGSCLDDLAATLDLVTLNAVVVASGTCIYDLTEEQQAILDEMYEVFQAEMDVLRAEMLLAATHAEKMDIRADMFALRDAHKEAVQALLIEWGYI